jgi:peptidylprolyl isomerase
MNPPQNKQSKWLPVIFLTLVFILVLVGVAYSYGLRREAALAPVIVPSPSAVPSSVAALQSPAPTPDGSPSPGPSTGIPSPGPSPTISDHPSVPGKLDLTVDVNGLSRSTVAITTPKGLIKFKLFATDAPFTVQRFVTLIQTGFYTGLTFHSVKPDFVIQGGDPLGTGRGGSGMKLKAEFNARHHIEGTVAMARTSDPNSADSQFYIALRPLPQLDNNYTVIGQVIEGMDVVHKIQPGDKMTSVKIE